MTGILALITLITGSIAAIAGSKPLFRWLQYRSILRSNNADGLVKVLEAERHEDSRLESVSSGYLSEEEHNEHDKN